MPAVWELGNRNVGKDMEVGRARRAPAQLWPDPTRKGGALLLQSSRSRGSQLNAIVCVSRIWENKDQAQNGYALGFICH